MQNIFDLSYYNENLGGAIHLNPKLAKNSVQTCSLSKLKKLLQESLCILLIDLSGCI